MIFEFLEFVLFNPFPLFDEYHFVFVCVVAAGQRLDLFDLRLTC